MAALSTFRLDLTDLARPVIELDGQDVTERVKGYVLEHEVGRTVPILTVELHPGAGEVVGLAQAQQAVPVDMLEQLAQLLEGFDPLQLEQAALNDPDLTMEKGAVTAGALREAARLLRGRA